MKNPFKSTKVPNLEIVPGVGIGPARLGMSRDDVAAAMTKYPTALPPRDDETCQFFFGSSLMIEYGNSGLVQFIEVRPRGPFKAVFKDQDVFDIAAPDLFALFAAGESSAAHAYDADGYFFPDQIIALYQADEQYDTPDDNGRPIWASIGVGSTEYRTAILALRAKRAKRDAERAARQEPT